MISSIRHTALIETESEKRVNSFANSCLLRRELIEISHRVEMLFVPLKLIAILNYREAENVNYDFEYAHSLNLSALKDGHRYSFKF